jgi:hypothetical protein
VHLVGFIIKKSVGFFFFLLSACKEKIYRDVFVKFGSELFIQGTLKKNAELPILLKYRYYVNKFTLHRHVYSLSLHTTCPRNCSRAAALSRVRNGAVLSSSFGVWCGYHRAWARNRFHLRQQFWSNSYTAKKTKCCRMNSLVHCSWYFSVYMVH